MGQPVTLGGTLFTHNVLQFDYCIGESLQSLLDLCDEVVVLDTCSTDGTLELLQSFAAANPKMKLISGAEWEVGVDSDRLRILANQAASHLTTDFHFMLQADEVIHENSFPIIRKIVNNKGYGKSSFSVRRWNLYGDFNHYVSLKSEHKPCNDAPTRLATTGIQAIADAESLEPVNWCTDYTDRIQIFHYGLVRKGTPLLNKCIDMQSWFFGPDGRPDQRIVDMREKGEWEPFKIIGCDQLTRITFSHPKYTTEWMRERAAEKDKWSTELA